MKLNVWRKQQDNINPKLIIIIAIFAIIVIAVFLSDLTTILSPCVGLIEINGEITMERVPNSIFAEGMPNAEDIASTIKNVEKTKPNVKALVVVINSPGGSVVGSRIIRESIKESKIPVVAYLSEVAASGGYYIATGSNYIIADPNTLTGSIGVIALFADARQLLEKIGVNITAVTTGKYKSMGSFFSGLSDDERAIVEQLLNESYNEFLDVILEGRKGKITRERLLSIADGRIMSGRQAKSYGLVDALGMKEDAIKKAKELANLSSDDGVCNIKVRAGQSSLIFSESSSFISSFINNFQGLKFK
ncbi:MAG: signal peptide peptidase SppA [Candidatus Anstonellales archaeon]